MPDLLPYNGPPATERWRKYRQFGSTLAMIWPRSHTRTECASARSVAQKRPPAAANTTCAVFDVHVLRF